MVVEALTFVEERRLRGIQVFGLNLLLKRPAAEGDDPARPVGDRKDHPIAEAIVGNGDVLSVHEKTGLNHSLAIDSARGEVIAQRVTIRWGIAEAKLLLQGRRDLPSREIGADLRARLRGELRFEKLRREFQHFDKRSALFLPRILVGRGRRQGDTGHRGESFDRFREADAFGFHHEFEGVAVLARGEIVEEALLVVDEE